MSITPPRRTKIVATLGPASSSEEVLRNMIEAGVDIVRMNMSHGSPEDHAGRIDLVRRLAQEANRFVAILVDLQGPKIRISRFKDKKIQLKKGDVFVLDARLGVEDGTQERVGIDYKELINDVQKDDVLLLDDGRMVLTVTKVENKQIFTVVETDGPLSNNKGINKQGGGLSADALTDKDKIDITLAAQFDADFVAMSFPRSAADINQCRDLLKKAGSNAGIVAKIERVEAVQNIDEIIKASDAVMVARGDLGVEIGDAELPAVQKHIVTQARHLDRGVIVATQMMESMIDSPIPTRAEVFDVANAVLDGTDAVMLSAETAVGINPPNVIRAMSRVCQGAEKQNRSKLSRHRMDDKFQYAEEGIAMASMYLANHMPVKAIISLTESGSTAIWMSRIRSGIPIFAVSRNLNTCRRLALYRGVFPHLFDYAEMPDDAVNKSVVNYLRDHHWLDDGDLIILTRGDQIGEGGSTNVLKLLRVGTVVNPAVR